MATVFDILKETKKDNCGRCGFPTCLAFSAAVHSGAVAKSACPFMEADDNEEPKVGQRVDPETALARQLRSKVKELDLSKRAPGLGGKVVSRDGAPVMQLHYLGRKVCVSSEYVSSEQGEELETRDQILLYNYLFFGGHGPLSGRWVGLESFPNSISKVVTLKKYTEDKIADAYKSRIQDLVADCKVLGGEEISPCYADVCIVVPVLPKVPVQVHFWDEDQEDGFPPKVKVLFDERALDFLDIESLIFAAERMAETLIGR